MLAVDVSLWLRSDASCSADRLFCHVYGRAKSASQFIPGRPYSFVAVLEPGATSWTGIVDVVRLDPKDDATAVTAAQLRAVIERLIAAGQSMIPAVGSGARPAASRTWSRSRSWSSAIRPLSRQRRRKA